VMGWSLSTLFLLCYSIFMLIQMNWPNSQPGIPCNWQAIKLSISSVKNCDEYDAGRTFMIMLLLINAVLLPSSLVLYLYLLIRQYQEGWNRSDVISFAIWTFYPNKSSRVATVAQSENDYEEEEEEEFGRNSESPRLLHVVNVNEESDSNSDFHSQQSFGASVSLESRIPKPKATLPPWYERKRIEPISVKALTASKLVNAIPPPRVYSPNSWHNSSSNHDSEEEEEEGSEATIEYLYRKYRTENNLETSKFNRIAEWVPCPDQIEHGHGGLSPIIEEEAEGEEDNGTVVTEIIEGEVNQDAVVDKSLLVPIGYLGDGRVVFTLPREENGEMEEKEEK